MRSIIELLSKVYLPEINLRKFGADATAHYFNSIPKDKYKETYEDAYYSCPDSWRNDQNINYWIDAYSNVDKDWNDEDLVTYFKLINWKCSHSEQTNCKHPHHSFYFELYKRHLIEIDHLYKFLLQEEGVLGTLTNGHTNQEILEQYPFLVPIIDDRRARILEIELQRESVQKPTQDPH